MTIYDIYKNETGKDATLFINHGIIFTSDYIKWLEEKFTSTNSAMVEISARAIESAIDEIESLGGDEDLVIALRKVDQKLHQ